MKNINPWAYFRNFILRRFKYLILTQIHSHIFSLAHWIWRKINTLKKEKILFETNMKLCNMRFGKTKIWEGVVSHNERLFQTLGEEPLSIISNICILLRYMFEGRNCKNFFHFDKFKMKKKKYVVLLLPFFMLLVSISYYRYSQGKHTLKKKLQFEYVE